MNDRELLAKIQNGEHLSQTELKFLVYECDQVDEVEGADHRWARDVTTVVRLCGKYVAIDWQRGLTENSVNIINNQPYFVHKEEKMIVVTNWIKNDPDYEMEYADGSDHMSDEPIYFEENSEHEVHPTYSSHVQNFIEILKNEEDKLQEQDQEQER